MDDCAATILWDGRYSVNNAPVDKSLKPKELIEPVLSQTAYSPAFVPGLNPRLSPYFRWIGRFGGECYSDHHEDL